MIQRSSLQIDGLDANVRARFEREAMRLNLSLAAYLEFLMMRQAHDVDAERLDEHVEEVFGKFGSTMRKLAE
ncbi:MAG: hypothetical protein AAGD00_08505 [Planctomycetota bacterium]